MNRIRWTLLLALLVTLVALVNGCGGAPKDPSTPANVAPEPPPPKDAASLARTTIGAKIGATIRVDRVREHPAGPRLVRLGDAAAIFDGTGIDLLRDADVAFVAATGITREDDAVVVVHHSVEQEKLRSALETVMDRSDPKGEWLQGREVPMARVQVQGHHRVVVLSDASHLVVLPEKFTDRAQDFAGPLKLESIAGPEAIVATIDQPSESLRAHRTPRIPPTISRADVTVTLRADGGLDAHADGTSTDDAQAKADADALTRSIERATSAKVAFVRVRFFKSVPFRAEGNHVRADLNLTDKELNNLLSMAEAFSRRQ